MQTKQDVEKNREMLYKSFELTPLAKMSLESGAEKTKFVVNTLQLLGNLATEKSLQPFGLETLVTPMDRATAQFIRDSATYSNAINKLNEGTIEQYGRVLPNMKDAAQTLVASASAIATVQEKMSGEIDVTRKKQLGLEDKHGSELLKEYHSLGGKKESSPASLDHEEQFMRDQLEKTPSLKEESLPSLKHSDGGQDVPKRRSRNPWNR